MAGGLTSAKLCLNQLSYDKGPLDPAMSRSEASARRSLLRECVLEPSMFIWEGQVIELGSGWIEKSVSLEHPFIWFSHYKEEEGYYLSFTAKSGSEIFEAVDEPYFRIVDTRESFTMQSVSGMPISFSAYSSDPIQLPVVLELVTPAHDKQKKRQLITARAVGSR
jgi:hypothetical protein